MLEICLEMKFRMRAIGRVSRHTFIEFYLCLIGRCIERFRMAISDKQAVERRTMLVARELVPPGGTFS